MIRAPQDTPATPVPSLLRAPIVPATCVPWKIEPPQIPQPGSAGFGVDAVAVLVGRVC